MNPNDAMLGKKYDGNFIFTFAVVKVRYSGITTTKIWKLYEVVIIILFLYMFIRFLLEFYEPLIYKS